jgi:hypothetical protein
VKIMHGEYRVSGRRTYRGHTPGSTFEAALPPTVEARALARRDIQLIRRIVPTIEADCLQLPSGWGDEPATEARASGPLQ